MRTIKADLHNHLRTSSRIKESDPDKVAEIILKRLGPGGAIGLVNFADNRYERFIEQPGYERVDIGNAVYFPEQDVLVVKGQEIPTKEGHILVLGIEKGKHLKGARTLGETIKEAKDHNGIIIADHPFYRDGLGPFLKENGYLDHFDAIEVHNGEAALCIPGLTPKNANQKAKEWYDEVKWDHRNLGAIASSDGHSFYEIGSSNTRLIVENWNKINSPEHLVSELRRAIRGNKYVMELTTRDSRFGALDHIGDLVTIVRWSKLPKFLKFGIKIDFEGKEPYRIKE